MQETKKAIDSLSKEMDSKEKRTVLSFWEFLVLVRNDPQGSLRRIFQLFHDLIKSYIGPGVDEYPDDPESIGFVKYDCSKLFINGSDNPFFADRLFANRFVRQAESLKEGSQQNRVYVYEGPPGCGKSTFLNNLLRAFEECANTKEGQSFEIFWKIDETLLPQHHRVGSQRIEVPCPSHDHPILIIPKKYRADFLAELLSKETAKTIFDLKEYEWVIKKDVCTICRSLFWELFDRLGSLDKVLNMVWARHYNFDRRLGEGISVFNPGDRPLKTPHLRDKLIQEKLDQVFGANLIKYTFSPYARTNNGIYVLMDIKSHNKERLLELHNVISEGVHKVREIEEGIDSLFLALMNPKDKTEIENEAESFRGRIQYNKISYVLDAPTEAAIYHNTFGKQIDAHFLPRVLENFARIIISSRMQEECKPLEAWIKDLGPYKARCDKAGLLLRMEIYAGIIPPWLTEKDKKNFTADLRRKLIASAEMEGTKGFTGRESIELFGDFFKRYSSKPNLINMANVSEYFRHHMGEKRRDDNIPKNFIGSLIDWYDFTILSEIKEALYFYNKKQISDDILNYLCAVSYDPGIKVRCRYTKQEIEVTMDFLKLIGSYVMGDELGDQRALDYAKSIQKKYTETVAQDPHTPITETELYQDLFESYIRNLKEKVLQPFVKNKNFRDAVKTFGGHEFNTFDSRLKEYVAHMIENLKKTGYTERGAREIVLYMLDKKLHEKFN